MNWPVLSGFLKLKRCSVAPIRVGSGSQQSGAGKASKPLMRAMEVRRDVLAIGASLLRGIHEDKADV